MLDQLEEILHPGTDPAPFTLTPPAPSPLPQPDLTFRHRLERDQVGMKDLLTLNNLNPGTLICESPFPRNEFLKFGYIFASYKAPKRMLKLPNLIMGDQVYYGEV